MIFFWLIPFLAMIISTINALWKLSQPTPGIYVARRVTIIKPLKGWHDGIEESLESFFKLQYPTHQYEICFCFESINDSAYSVFSKLALKYPEVNVSSYYGTWLCYNPKIANMLEAYANVADNDLILVSDSSAKVEPNYLKKMVSHMNEGVGVVTGLVAGTNPTSFGGMVEAVYLNSFFARARIFADTLGFPSVMGMSMLFRKADAEKFGGFRALSNYLAEDYMLGEKMQELGLKIAVMMEPVKQNLGNYSLKTFFSRHVRWGRLRKSHYPIAFLFEPFTMPLVFGILGALSFKDGFDQFFFVIGTMAAAFICDLIVLKMISPSDPSSAPGLRPGWSPWVGAWLFREITAFPLWVYTLCGNSINWKGSKLRLKSGGIIERA